MFEFTIPWNDVADTVTNLNFLNSPILNENGFVGIENGHFVYNEQRIRFFGGSLSFGANFPENETAEIIAARLAKLGVNLVRLCLMDFSYSTYGQGIWDPEYEDKRHLDEDQLEKLDYLINEFKQKGIFVDLMLHVSRTLTDADGIEKDENMPPNNKGVDIFDATMRKIHKEYATQLLTHVNQYTHLPYYNDPVIAMVEVTNEDSLLQWWKSGWPNGYIDDLGEFYQNELDNLWEFWWMLNYPDDTLQERPTRNQVRLAECSQQLAQRYIDFLLSLEEDYHQDMEKHLRTIGGTTGVRVPISGTQHGPLDSVLSSTFHDKHRCWGCWTGDNYFVMDSIVEDPFRSNRNVIPFLSGAKVTGKPYVATEVSSPAPNYHAAEPILLAALYGAFQDWDGILPYAYKHYSDWDRNRFGDSPPNEYCGSKFDFDRHMTKMVAFTVAALLFRRNDIGKGQDPPLQVITTRQDVLNEAIGEPPLDMDFNGVTHAIRYLPEYATLMKRIEIDKGEEHFQSQTPLEPDPPIYETDTGELQWQEPDEGQGIVKVDAENIQALVGYIEDPQNPFEFEHGLLDGGSIRVLDIESTAIIAVILKESTPASNTYLIIATGKIENEGLDIDETSPGSGLFFIGEGGWGSEPILVEGIDANITIPIPINNVEWYALDPQGYRDGDPLPKDDLGTACGLHLSPDHETLWYELIVAQVG